MNYSPKAYHPTPITPYTPCGGANSNEFYNKRRNKKNINENFKTKQWDPSSANSDLVDRRDKGITGKQIDIIVNSRCQPEEQKPRGTKKSIEDYVVFPYD